jgi:dihydrofolate reductase
VDWNARLLRDIVPEEIIKMKEKPGQDLVIAGASIGSTLAQMGLIDECEPFVHPAVLGSGKPMFNDIQHRLNSTFLRAQTFRSGVVVLRYQAAQSDMAQKNRAGTSAAILFDSRS